MHENYPSIHSLSMLPSEAPYRTQGCTLPGSSSHPNCRYHDDRSTSCTPGEEPTRAGHPHRHSCTIHCNKPRRRHRDSQLCTNGVSNLTATTLEVSRGCNARTRDAGRGHSSGQGNQKQAEELHGGGRVGGSWFGDGDEKMGVDGIDLYETGASPFIPRSWSMHGTRLHLIRMGSSTADLGRCGGRMDWIEGSGRMAWLLGRCLSISGSDGLSGMDSSLDLIRGCLHSRSSSRLDITFEPCKAEG